MGYEDYSTPKRKWKQVTEKERYQIEALYRAKFTPREIATQLGRDRRTIERELKIGLTKQLNSDLTEKMVYLTDAAQRNREQNASEKGRGLKIGNDLELVSYIEQKIGEEKWSPDAVIGEIKTSGLVFKTSICTKTLYNMTT